jgi:hypothetical protein
LICMYLVDRYLLKLQDKNLLSWAQNYSVQLDKWGNSWIRVKTK